MQRGVDFPVDLDRLSEELENLLASYIKKAWFLVKFPRSMKQEYTPRYREAYPALDVVAAKAAFDRSDTICEFTDRFDERLGVARFDVSGDRCQLEHEFRFPCTETCTGWIEFELALIPNGIAKNRVMILCPGCHSKKKIVFFKVSWRCASCLDLSFRSQLIHPVSQKWENLDALSYWLKHGKPHGMHNMTYEKLMLKQEALRKSLYGKQRRYASDKYSSVVKSTWRPPTPRNHYSFPSIKSYAKFIGDGEEKHKPATAPSISPGPADDGVYRFHGGFETDDPEMM